MSTTSASTKCIACDASNGDDSQFCNGCGHFLFEPCGGCGKTTSISQKFCNACGSNLQTFVQTRRERLQESLRQSIAAVKEHRYDEAIDSLTADIEKRDHRFKDLQDQAAAAIEKINHLRTTIESSAVEKMANAEAAFEQGQHSAVVAFLQGVPGNLLSDTARSQLKQSQQFVHEDNELQSELKATLKTKDWLLSGSLASRLLELHPDDATYQKLVKQIGDKILAAATKLIDAGKFGAAANYLSAIPEAGRNDTIEKMSNDVEQVVWLQTQFVDQPFATPTLLNLARRLHQIAPNHRQGETVAKEIAAVLARESEDSRCRLRTWHGERKPLLGDQFRALQRAASVDWSGVKWSDPWLSRHHIAIGLAATGIGLGRVDGNLMPPEKNMIGGLLRRKRDRCWGVDIGSSGIRAVLVNNTDSKPVIENVYLDDWNVGELKTMDQNDRINHLRLAVKKMVSEIEFGDVPVWINMTAIDTISHFLRLPPVNAKQAAKLLDTEVGSRIPLDASEIQTICWHGEANESQTNGISALIVASRNQAVQQRRDLLQSSGLKISGITSTGIALSNFADLEFASQNKKSTEDDKKSKSKKAPSDDREAIAILDCGQQTTTLLINSPHDVWYGTFESGGDAITAAIAKSERVVHGDAELLKKEPWKLQHPAQTWGDVSNLFQRWKSTLDRLVGESQKFNHSIDVSTLWCVGGGSRTHNFLRDVVQNNE